MSQLIGPIFGNGQDGDGVISSNSDLNSTKTSCSGTAGSTTLTVASTTGFSVGDLILIHKSRGNTTTSCGTWELNRITLVGSGQFTLGKPLTNSYQDSGADQSQCVLIPEYRSLTINNGITVTPANWDGDVGGITILVCSGKMTVQGNININGGNGASLVNGNGTATSGGGFKGGACRYVSGSFDFQAWQGEGSAGGGTTSYSANGNGGGGGHNQVGDGGAGGSNGSQGTNGQNGTNARAGDIAGSNDLVTCVFGGGGGGGWKSGDPADPDSRGGDGGSGGGIVIIYSKIFELTGAINVNGGNGGTPSNSADQPGGGGAGASGGSVLIKGEQVNIGTDKISAIGGNGQTSPPNSFGGGYGGKGRVRVEGCKLTGSVASSLAGTISLITGGHKWCGSLAGVL